ncbi:glycosyl transferase family 21-domain-containing protein [Paraphysoderma sedebokerense]|nr:glycosyl transferase family 21-domain-containing protein [Paraphysoderma sedebokerense]
MSHRQGPEMLEYISSNLLSVWRNVNWTDMERLFVWISLGWWIFLTSVIASALFISFSRYRKQNKFLALNAATTENTLQEFPPVTILRPLKGVDCNLSENLECCFLQNYPNFELVFSVASPSDPAIQVVAQLIQKYPHIDTKLIIGERNIGVNPKINNLIRGYEQAKNDIIWILDSNIWIGPQTLLRSVTKLCRPNVGLVHHLPLAVRPQSFGSELELCFLNSTHAKMYLGINFLAPSSCVIGKSNMFRRSDLNKCGGLQAFGKYMAEDNMIGQAIWDLGLKHEMTEDIAWQSLGSMTVADFFLRRSRWTRIRKYTVVAATCVEPITESFMFAIFSAYPFYKLWNVDPLQFIPLQILCWLLTDLTIYWNLVGATFSFKRFIISWLVREITALPLYFWAVTGNTVDWRESSYILKRGGTVEKCTESNILRRHAISFMKKPFFSSVITTCAVAINIAIEVIREPTTTSSSPSSTSTVDSRAISAPPVSSCHSTLSTSASITHEHVHITYPSSETSALTSSTITPISYFSPSSPPFPSSFPSHSHSPSEKSLEPHQNHHHPSDEDRSDNESVESYNSSASSSSSSIYNQENRHGGQENGYKLLDRIARRKSRSTPSLWEILKTVSVGVSMHLQNERNELEIKTKRKVQSFTSSAPSSSLSSSRHASDSPSSSPPHSHYQEYQSIHRSRSTRERLRKQQVNNPLMSQPSIRSNVNSPFHPTSLFNSDLDLNSTSPPSRSQNHLKSMSYYYQADEAVSIKKERGSPKRNVAPIPVAGLNLNGVGVAAGLERRNRSGKIRKEL